MSELVFPVTAFALTMLALMPALSLASRWLLHARRQRTRRWAEFGTTGNLALLIAPVLLPLTWLISSAFHQSETDRANDPCLLEHGVASTCIDAAILLGLVALWMGFVVARTWWNDRASLPKGLQPADRPAAERVAALCAQTSALASLAVHVVSGAPEPVFVQGVLRPRVFVDAGFVARVDDDVLLASLLHEAAHVRRRDTTLGFMLRFCQASNPAAAWLAPDAERWLHAREALCDRDAVHAGGSPLALAHGLLQAMRLRSAPPALNVASLCGDHNAVLRLRIALLLGGIDRDAMHDSRVHAALPLLLLVAAASIAPHVEGYGVLEHFHLLVEQGTRSLGH